MVRRPDDQVMIDVFSPKFFVHALTANHQNGGLHLGYRPPFSYVKFALEGYIEIAFNCFSDKFSSLIQSCTATEV